MPDQISVSEFLSETTDDYNSPTTSSFTTRLQSCRNTVSVLEESQNKHVDGLLTGLQLANVESWDLKCTDSVAAPHIQ
ncbi:UNVERIFIED_CONTAM: hypothetical protein FKN15_029626 [Acipenser sinensis]